MGQVQSGGWLISSGVVGRTGRCGYFFGVIIGTQGVRSRNLKASQFVRHLDFDFRIKSRPGQLHLIVRIGILSKDIVTGFGYRNWKFREISKCDNLWDFHFGDSKVRFAYEDVIVEGIMRAFYRMSRIVLKSERHFGVENLDILGI